MTGLSPPLRFLALAVGGWVCVRAVVLAPQWWIQRGEAAPAPAPATPAAALPRAPAAGPPWPARAGVKRPAPRLAAAAALQPARRPAAAAGRTGAIGLPLLDTGPAMRAAAPPGEAATIAAPPFAPPAPLARRTPSRWSASAWALLRREPGAAALAPGGTLGGSQAGARLLYRLNRDSTRPLALGARLSMPLRRRGGAEAAAGLDWRPLAQVPLNLLVERREALGSDGRSGFAVAVYGGGGARLPGGLRLEAYGQAGLVGLRRRDPFADGSARLAVPLGRLEIGAAAWGAAQPRAARLDAGPQVSFRLPAGAGAELRLEAGWRFRLAGDSAPGSGPAITLATNF